MSKISRVNKNQKSVISCSSSNEYAPYLCVFLQSLVENTCINKLYDIVILSRTITDYNKKTILEHFNRLKHVSIRFFDPTVYFVNVRQINSIIGNFPDDVYNRIAAPVIFEDYDKVIYTDIDMVVQDDILNLSEIDLEGKAIAACKEPMWKVYVDRNTCWRGIYLKDYAKNTLGLADPCDYYNTGLIVFDVKQCLRLNSFTSILEMIQCQKYFLPEQCATTAFFNKNIKELSPIWNYFTSKTVFNNEFRSDQYYQDYFKLEPKANIFHYVHGKPWDDKYVRHSDVWWEYAVRTPYFSTSMFEIFLSFKQDELNSKLFIDKTNNSLIINFNSDEIISSWNNENCIDIILKIKRVQNNHSRILCVKKFLDSKKIKNYYDDKLMSYKILKSDYIVFFNFVTCLFNDFMFNAYYENLCYLFYIKNLINIIPKKFNVKNSINSSHSYFSTDNELYKTDIGYDVFEGCINRFGYCVSDPVVTSNEDNINKFRSLSSDLNLKFNLEEGPVPSFNMYFINKSLSCSKVDEIYKLIENTLLNI